MKNRLSRATTLTGLPLCGNDASLFYDAGEKFEFRGLTRGADARDVYEARHIPQQHTCVSCDWYVGSLEEHEQAFFIASDIRAGRRKALRAVCILKTINDSDNSFSLSLCVCVRLLQFWPRGTAEPLDLKLYGLLQRRRLRLVCGKRARPTFCRASRCVICASAY